MALIKLDPNEEIPYIPIAQRKQKEPLTLWVTYVSAVMYDEWLRRLGKDLSECKTAEEKQIVTRQHDKRWFTEKVKRVDNYLDSSGKPITDINDLYENIDYATRNEVIEVFMNHAVLSESQRKNLKGG